jgi:hypothetical protein
MKKLMLFVFVLFFGGCSHDNTSSSDLLSNIDTKTIQTASAGEECGGIDGKKCSPGLECKREYLRAESKGVCISTVVDTSLACEPIKNPVCGQKGRQKNGYLNACEAERHGAEILYTGLCKVNTPTSNPCEAKSQFIGNCEIFSKGYEFDGSSCVSVHLSGCEKESPFSSLSECQRVCE